MAATGFAGLASLAFLRIRTRRPIIGRILVLETALLAALAVMIVAFYADNAGPSRGAGGGTVIRPFAFASMLLQGIVYAMVFLVLWRLKPTSRLARGVGIAAQVLSAVNVLLPAIYLYLWADALFREAPIPPAFLGGLGYVVTAGAVAAFGLQPLSLDFLFYLGLNVVSCMAFAKSLSGESGRAYGELSGAAADSLGLPERERAMVEMIARGLANKEIASELCISPATVRTHIYNLYRKVGARSRVERLNKIAGR
jgi:DNA-binding CsgD family transcriptional regulator